MPGYLWSDPTPSNATSAVLSAPYKVDAANIGPLVNAILQFRESQNKAQQQSYSDLLKGVSSGVSGFYGAYQKGQANDAANAAIYGSQYPNDPYGGYTNPDVVPDYGGTNALKALQGERELNPDAFMSDYKRMLMESQIDRNDALTEQSINGPQIYTAPNGQQYMMGPRGGMKSLSGLTAGQELTKASGAQGAAEDYFDQYGISQDALNNPDAVHGPSNTPYQYGPPPKDGYPGQRTGTPTVVPEGQNLIVDPKTGSYQYVTPEYLQEARQALEAFHQAQSNYREKLGIQTPAGAAPGVRQADVDQAAQAPAPVPTQLAPGYGNKGVTMRAPDGTVSTVDPDLVDYYKKKGAVVVQ